MITGDNLRAHELVGLEAEAVRPGGGQAAVARGVVVDETMRTIALGPGRPARVVPKAGSTWRFSLEGGQAEVRGEDLVGRPHERLARR